jgi:DNA-damage-inducible protein J
MAATKANLNIRVDSDVKQRAAALFAKMGLDMTSAIEMFLRQSLKENGIPFKPEAEKSLDEQLTKALHEHSRVRLELAPDKNGNMFIDKDKYPDLYDWAVNG